MLPLFRPITVVLLLSILFAGCSSGGSSDDEETLPEDHSGVVAGKTYYSISETEIGVIDLHAQGDATVTRTLVALDHTEQVNAQWQISDSTLSIDIGTEHREFGIDGNGDALIEGALQWQQIITPSAQLLAGDFWLDPPDRDPIQHFQFNANGSGVVYFYLSDEPASAAMQWEIESKTVIVRYNNLNVSERFFIVGNPEPGHLSVIVFGGSLFNMYSYLAELVPFSPPAQTVATAAQISGKHFHGWLENEQQLLELRNDHGFSMITIPNDGTGSQEENGSWQIDDAGVLTLDADNSQRQLMAKMGQQPFLESGNYRYRFFDIVQNPDIAGINWSSAAGGLTFWFDINGTGTMRMGPIGSGSMPFTWEQQQDRIRLVLQGDHRVDWLVTVLDRNLGMLYIKMLTLGESGYRSLDSMSFGREQLPPATSELISGHRFYRLDDKKAELLRLQTSSWFDSQTLDMQTDSSSDDHGHWQIDSDGQITLAGEQLSRTLLAVDLSGSAHLQEGSSSYYPLQMNLTTADLIGQWQAVGGFGSLLINGDGTGSIVNNSLSSSLDFSWQITDDHAHIEFSASPSLIYDWYLTAPTQSEQAPSILQCTVSGDGCSDVAFLPFLRQ